MKDFYKITVIFCLFIVFIPVQAQLRNLEGNVTDEKGIPVTDVKVTPKGSEQSVFTDENGFYSLTNVPDSVCTLNFAHPDMKPASATIGIYDKIDVCLCLLISETPPEMSLEELLEMRVEINTGDKQHLSPKP
ncbi:MAG: carboxypeptidase regulatory-like domain-containing protein [Bacteroidales bacterium]|nr:carboxypeptidase regulatory-like domain-containing protein [Bacteroidales bacterium]